MQKLKNYITDLFFPAKCLICNKISQNICIDCINKIQEVINQTCPNCNKLSKYGAYCNRCKKNKYISGIIAFGYFRNPILKKVIYELKYEGVFSVSDQLAGMLTKTILKEDIIFDIISFVPISKKSLRHRGYNQSELIANSLSEYFKKPVFSLLTKTKETKSQVGLSGKERRNNLFDAFIINEKNSNKLIGKKILIIDDVCTTGSTLNECAKILKNGGAKKIHGAVIAKE